jgi:3',5'-cyclic AMP phosphodiesterase CpdA
VDRPVVLVHLSDIHFQGADAGAEIRNASLRADLVNDLREQRDRHGDVTAIVVTGDIAYSADPSEYDKARSWLNDVAAAVGLDSALILTVPGNHDVHWASIGDASDAAQASGMPRGRNQQPARPSAHGSCQDAGDTPEKL